MKSLQMSYKKPGKNFLRSFYRVPSSQKQENQEWFSLKKQQILQILSINVQPKQKTIYLGSSWLQQQLYTPVQDQVYQQLQLDLPFASKIVQNFANISEQICQLKMESRIKKSKIKSRSTQAQTNQVDLLFNQIEICFIQINFISASISTFVPQCFDSLFVNYLIIIKLHHSITRTIQLLKIRKVDYGCLQKKIFDLSNLLRRIQSLLKSKQPAAAERYLKYKGSDSLFLYIYKLFSNQYCNLLTRNNQQVRSYLSLKIDIINNVRRLEKNQSQHKIDMKELQVSEAFLKTKYESLQAVVARIR